MPVGRMNGQPIRTLGVPRAARRTIGQAAPTQRQDAAAVARDSSNLPQFNTPGDQRHECTRRFQCHQEPPA